MGRSLVLGAVLGALVTSGAPGAEPGELHVLYTSEVRGTVGICG